MVDFDVLDASQVLILHANELMKGIVINISRLAERDKYLGGED
jgi:hypothetical protein